MLSTASRMSIVSAVAVMRRTREEARARGARVSFVPTMGYLHEGHLRLVDEARRHADLVVVSIFVNRLQFGPTEDFARYPRDPDGDAAKAAARGVDVLFMPLEAELYRASQRVTVTAPGLAARWEGEIRPGHFDGVLTVVAKLFNIVHPDVAVFGQKDIQQATLIRAMVEDLDFPVTVLVAPTVREPDGLAMSSRNVYLSESDRRSALALSAALRDVEAAYERGERHVSSLEAIGRRRLAEDLAVRVDYFALIDPATLDRAAHVRAGTIVAVAARVGSTRLIDNLILGGL
jgi:pantoate--beta-alanine ligase